MKEVLILLLIIIVMFGMFGIYKSYKKKQRSIYNQYITPSNIKINLYQKGDPNKLIWSYWHSDDLPFPVKLSLASWQYFHPDWTIHMVTKSTLHNFLNPTEFPPSASQSNTNKTVLEALLTWVNGQFDQNIQQSDIIRLLLLEKYGGMWLDSSIILQSRIDSQWFPQNYDSGGFYIDLFTTDQNYKVFESWFISAPKNSPLLKLWKNEFFYALTFKKRADYIQLLQNEKIPIDGINGKEYLMIHCCFLRVIKNNPSKFKIKQSEVCDRNHGPFYYLSSRNWKTSKSVQSLIVPSTNSDITQPIIKLRGGERRELDSQKDLIQQDSVIGKLMCKINM
jgi:hypothetical protein